MIDKAMRVLKHRLLRSITKGVGRFLGPMPITLLALVVGLAAAWAAALEATGAALVLWFLNRIIDGLDGEVARFRGESSDLGGYIDMMGDVVVYAAIPLALALAHGELQVTAALLIMIASFYINVTSWAYLSALLEKRQAQASSRFTSIAMPAGLIEGTETILVYALLIAAPGIIVQTALVAAAAGLMSAAQRMIWAVRTLKDGVPSMNQSPSNKIYRYGNYEVRYGVQGSGPPLVAVHGTPWSSYNLRHLIAGLSRNYRVYYYDMLGYGNSDKPETDVSLGVQNELLSELIAHWGLERPIALGHDYGGATLLRTTLLNSVAFEKLILIDPVAVSPWGSEFLQHVRQYEAAFSGMPEYMHRALLGSYIDSAATHDMSPETKGQTMAPWTGREGQAAFYRQIAQADESYTNIVEGRYQSITTPTLILWGAEDTWIPVDVAHRLGAMIPSASVTVIPNTGHLVIEEDPRSLLEAMHQFLGVR